MLSAYQNQFVSLKLQTTLYTNLKQTLCSPLSKDQCIKQKNGFKEETLWVEHTDLTLLEELTNAYSRCTLCTYSPKIHNEFFCKIRTLLGSILWSM